jgi:hypothetical protein
MIRMAHPLPTRECPSFRHAQHAQCDERIENDSGRSIEQYLLISNRIRHADWQRETVRLTSWPCLYGINEHGHELAEVDGQ